ncbi:MAG: sugar phosphate isomerase/epimerase [Oscillospiraceae bacterium]|nr:sugar phosphate isomerase/epimerase [Oscillospiraceae bacterium]
MKIGCQTITFGNERHQSDAEGIIKTVASAGYKGVETAFFRIIMNKTETYKQYLRENNIEQAAIHVGGNFNDHESVKSQLDNMPHIIKLAHELECKNIFLSGSPANFETGCDFAAENINKFGKMISENGLVLSYHNHDWEIKNNYSGLYFLCDNTDPKYLSFVPDVGWVTRGEGNPVEVLKRLGARVSNLHFKEFTNEGKITELGRGIVDFGEVYEFIKTAKNVNDTDMWIIAEQDETSIGAEASVEQNFEYIKNLVKV